MFGVLKWIFGSAQERLLRRYQKMAEAINQKAEEFNDFSKLQLKEKTQEFKDRIAQGQTLDSILVEAYAVVKVMCQRMYGEKFEVMGQEFTWELVPYDVQLVGACALHEGGCTQMQTGEGKTLTATLPLYLNALKQSSHLVTVNDYLAQRDCEWTGQILRELGLSTGFLTNGSSPMDRKKVYECDVVYGTASEFGFDYLRDNSMAQSQEEQVQMCHYYAIIDEADSILIDEARTPLIISGPSASSKHLYNEIKDIAASLIKKQREESSRWVNEAKRTLDKLQLTQHEEEISKLDISKEGKQELEQAIDLLWKVSKTTPRHRILKKLKENPNIRKLLDDRDLFYYSEANKALREEAIADLLILVDEKRGDYELTEKGIDAWIQCHGKKCERDPGQDFVMLNLGDEFLKIDENSALTEEEKMQERIKIQQEDECRKERAHNLRQLLKAHLLMEKDVEYIIQDEKIIIIDENTGRPQPGRRFSDGLHQAIEAKESVAIQRETQTYATITLQNYFRLYDKRAGMSGTCSTEAKEFKEIYNMEVIEIPTHLPCRRKDAQDLVFITEREKYQALLRDVKELHAQGRPILIGTESVDISEKLSRIFKTNRLEHTVLNAKNHAKEAQIIALAGQRGAITISTNMAGRGTDIKLGEGVGELGGLHVIGTTRHNSRRIDRQLSGRCGRQGDLGTSQFYVSFEDQLMRLFANDRMNAIIQRYRPEEGEPIVSSMLSAAIENAQKRVEQHHYAVRKHTLEYDNVMNVQRQEIYAFRNDLIHGKDISTICKELIEETVEMIWQQNQGRGLEDFVEALRHTFPVPQIERNLDKIDEKNRLEEVSRRLLASWEAKVNFQKRKLEMLPPLDPDFFNKTLARIVLTRLDSLWQLHLNEMDQIRADVQLRALGQKDPLMEYKQEAFSIFEELNTQIKLKACEDLFRFDLVPIQQKEALEPSESFF